MRIGVALLLLLTVVAAGQRSAGASATFSPESVFALPAHNYIDDRCQDARHFAEHASKTTADLDLTASLDGARAFMRCFLLPRIQPDEDAQRYLYLASATGIYVAATKADGDYSLTLFKQADRMARELGATEPDHTVLLEHVETGRTYANPAPANPGKEFYVVNHNPLGLSHPGTYTNVANAMVRAIDAQQLAAPQPSAAPGKPSPAPT